MMMASKLLAECHSALDHQAKQLAFYRLEEQRANGQIVELAAQLAALRAHADRLEKLLGDNDCEDGWEETAVLLDAGASAQELRGNTLSAADMRKRAASIRTALSQALSGQPEPPSVRDANCAVCGGSGGRHYADCAIKPRPQLSAAPTHEDKS
jgi:hypothetical protein